MFFLRRKEFLFFYIFSFLFLFYSILLCTLCMQKYQLSGVSVYINSF
nr:MAG TPA: hypothetical protein [Caudoviricetes sp.]